MDEPNCGGAGLEAVPVRALSVGAGRMVAAAGRFPREARGSTAIEYALIGSLIFLIAAGSIRAYVARMTGVYSSISAAVSQNN